jgi:hypothetical protein
MYVNIHFYCLPVVVGIGLNSWGCEGCSWTSCGCESDEGDTLPNSFGSIIARSMATGNPLDRPRTITKQSTTFDGGDHAPLNE